MGSGVALHLIGKWCCFVCFGSVGFWFPFLGKLVFNHKLLQLLTDQVSSGNAGKKKVLHLIGNKARDQVVVSCE